MINWHSLIATPEKLGIDQHNLEIWLNLSILSCITLKHSLTAWTTAWISAASGLSSQILICFLVKTTNIPFQSKFKDEKKNVHKCSCFLLSSINYQVQYQTGWIIFFGKIFFQVLLLAYYSFKGKRSERDFTGMKWTGTWI